MVTWWKLILILHKNASGNQDKSNHYFISLSAGIKVLATSLFNNNHWTIAKANIKKAIVKNKLYQEDIQKLNIQKVRMAGFASDVSTSDALPTIFIAELLLIRSL
jgi:hypothetical protein